MTHTHSDSQDHEISCSVITVSDTRTAETDESGRTITGMLLDQKHQVSERVIVKDDLREIQQAIQMAREKKVNVVILTGGTGISPRDVTYEAIQKLIERELPGFGELFRMLSYEE